MALRDELARQALKWANWRWHDKMQARIRFRDNPCGPVEKGRASVPYFKLRVGHFEWMCVDDHDPLPDFYDSATFRLTEDLAGIRILHVRALGGYIAVQQGMTTWPPQYGKIYGDPIEALVGSLEAECGLSTDES